MFGGEIPMFVAFNSSHWISITISMAKNWFILGRLFVISRGVENTKWWMMEQGYSTFPHSY